MIFVNKRNSYRSYILSYVIYSGKLPFPIDTINFRLLLELYSLLFKKKAVQEFVSKLPFPSPIGVIFSLMFGIMFFNDFERYRGFRLLSELYSHLSGYIGGWLDTKSGFPSPIGVIFSLILILIVLSSAFVLFQVSVSYRSYILTYPILKKTFVCNSL